MFILSLVCIISGQGRWDVRIFALFRPEYVCYTLYSMVMLLHSSLRSSLVGERFSGGI